MKALIMTIPQDFHRLSRHYKRMLDCIPADELVFVGCKELEADVRGLNLENVSFLDEAELIPFDDVRNCMIKRLKGYVDTTNFPRGTVGWHYQQFLKMEYARKCPDEYYIVWDGDTVPCAPFEMFSEDGIPLFDMKWEDNPLYFETLSRVFPNMKKVVAKSFISEHMIFSKKIMCEMLDAIERNNELSGEAFWEKIIYALNPDTVGMADFSEFETYGTYVCLNHLGEYKMRTWHSLRWAGEFLDPDTIKDEDFEWLSKDLHAVTFEKSASVRDDCRNLFDNKRYQEKLTPRQMIEIAQEEFQDGWLKERWD